MQYNTKTKNTKQLDFGHYKLDDRGGQIVIVNEWNTRVIYEIDGRIDKWRTVKSLLRYRLYQKTRGIRHYASLVRLSRDYSVS